jgi:hypothetical protein
MIRGAIKYNKYSVILLWAVLCFAGSKAQNTQRHIRTVQNGVVVVKVRGFDTTSNTYLPYPNMPDERKWYKDSLVIEEIYRIYQYNDPYGKITWDIKVIRYAFINLKTWEIYEYHNFSDTAKMIRKCPAGDSSCIRQCWRFWDKYGFMRAYGTLSPLPDTTIDGEQFKRVKRLLQTEGPRGKVEVTTHAYFSIPKKGKLIAFDYPYSKIVGYPMVKFEETNPSFPDMNVHAEVEYLPRSLTAEELKVFAAWERNAKVYKKKK